MNYNEEMSFMKTMDQLSKWLETPKAYVLNPERVKLLGETCRKLQAVLDEECHDCKVVVKPCPLGFGDVSVSFDTYSLTIRNMKKFFDAVQYLDNFEVYAAGDEVIHFAGVFSKVATVQNISE